VVRIAVEQLSDSVGFPVGQTKGPMERLFRDRGQTTSIASASAAPGSLRPELLQALEGGLRAVAYSCDECGFIRWQRADKTESPARLP
jgi:hypothetical protein